MADSAFLQTARARWKAATSADSDQRQREKDDLAFLVDHWPADIRASRSGVNVQGAPTAGQQSLPPVPARPTIQIDTLTEPISRVLNQERQSDIGIQIVPADDFADLGITLDETEITLREGLVRRIQRESQAADARTWAFQRAVEAGRGYYLVMTRFAPGKTWDREIYLHRIYNQDQVRLDPAHEQPDGSDANWGFVGGWMPADVYRATYPSKPGKRNRLSDATDTDWTAFAEDAPDWVSASDDAMADEGKGGGPGKAVYLVDYWCVEMTPRALALLPDGSSAWLDELPKGVEPVDTRDVTERTVRYAKLDGINDFALDEQEWEGPDIPIVKVLGRELQPFDGERRAQGMVRGSRDSAFGMDAMISKQVEMIALTPIPPVGVDPVAIEGYEAWYAVMNQRALPFVPYRTYDEQGRQLGVPARLNADPNILPVAQSIAFFQQAIQTTTGVSDPSLGRTDPTVKSQKHAKFLTDQSDFGTSNFLDNLVRSMRYEGQIINNLLFPIYGRRKGRLVRTLTGEGESQTMRVNPQDAKNQAIAQAVEQAGVLTEHARFNVIIKVTRSYTSRREQEASIIGELLNANPELLGVYGDLFFKNQDGPGHMEMAERAKVMLVPPIQQYLQQKEQGQAPIPPQVQAQMAAMQQQLQHADAALKELYEEARGKKIEALTKLQVEQLKAEHDARVKKLEVDRDILLAQMDNATKIRVAEIGAETKGVQFDHEHETQALNLAAEHAESELQREHERSAAMQAAQHEAGMGAAEAGVAAEEGERARQAQADEAALSRDHEATLSQAQLDAQAAAAQESEE